MTADSIPPDPTPSPAPAPSQPAISILPDGELRTFAPEEGDLSPMYVLDVFGVAVSIYVILHGTTMIQMDTVDAVSQPRGHWVSYEVNNGGVQDIGPLPDDMDAPEHDATGPAGSGPGSGTDPETDDLRVEDLKVGERIVYQADRTDVTATIESIDLAMRIVHVRTPDGILVGLNSYDVQQSHREN